MSHLQPLFLWLAALLLVLLPVRGQVKYPAPECDRTVISGYHIDLATGNLVAN